MGTFAKNARDAVVASLLLAVAAGWQGCASEPRPETVVFTDPVVGQWNCDSDNEGAAKALIFAAEHYVLTKGGTFVRWNLEAPNFYKVNHTTTPVELYYLADEKTLYLLGYGGNSREIVDIVDSGYPLDDLHQRGLLPLLVKYRRAASPKPRN
ncbi:MAG: hypothetical protein LBD14_00545 [Puniceicoccales bacterium]|jgi:hypothetical protein|nr:hypothetical protein [Puniceicoccales bacterium]